MGTPEQGRLPPLPVELRLRLRAARNAQGLGYKRLGQRIGVAHSHLSRIERGIRVPSTSVAVSLAYALNLDADTKAWLISESSFRGRSAGGRVASTPPNAGGSGPA